MFVFSCLVLGFGLILVLDNVTNSYIDIVPFSFFCLFVFNYINSTALLQVKTGLSLHYPTEAKQNEYQARTAVRFPVNRKCMEHLNGHFLTMKYVDDTWALG